MAELPATAYDGGSGAAATGIEAARDPDAGSRARAFLLLRFTLIIAVGYLVVVSTGAGGVSPMAGVLLTAAVLTNVGLLFAPRSALDAPWFTTAVVVVDTVWTTAVIVLSGRGSADLFYVYFFVLFLAAVGENLRVVTIGAVTVCVAYVAAMVGTATLATVLEPRFLIRLPFLFAVAIFYGYLVDRIRREKAKAERDALVVSRLEQSRVELEEANRTLAAEVGERHRAEDSLRHANERLHELSEIRSRFFTNVSHEIRTPLTSIKNAVSLFPRRSGPDDEKELLGIIRRNADRLNLIISDILDISRMEAGKLRVRATRVDVQDIVSGVVRRSLADAEAARVGLEELCDAMLPPVRADQRRVEQILDDLVSNAIRATASGGSVTVRATAAGAFVSLSVEDTGVGLSAADRQRVFEPFYRVGSELVGRPAGAGLGLTICRDLAHGHGSELDVESTPGIGSRFSFRLPIESARATEILELEEEMRSTYCRYPYFSVVVVEQSLATGPGLVADTTDQARDLERIRTRLKGVLPRHNDRFVVQPAHGRLVLVLLTTPRDGGWVVRRRVAAALADEPSAADGRPLPKFRVFGPSCFPEDGNFGARLVGEALKIETEGDEEAT